MKKNIITHYFEADHGRLDQMFAQFQTMKRVDFSAAKPFFRHFLRGLKRHIVWEEDILFPVFEAKSGLPQGSGPTEVMRGEHRMIGGYLEALHNKVRQADPNSDIEEKNLLETLSAHNMKEENILYPLIDRVCSPDEAAQIFAAMEEVSEERWSTCCGNHEIKKEPAIEGN